MSYLVFARKFRPQTFSEVSGQEQVTRTLANSIRRGRIGHAYLFAGPRGVGKTSGARIFAKGLNCKQGPTTEPCGVCANCMEIAQGIHLSVREIDGASHNSVDNVRELIETFRSLPAPGTRYKIYIIDEVHMLSTAAFNALLKSLEEPPPHTVFVLATTEAHKIPETVISRCQRHDFRALGQRVIEDCLRGIVEAEKLQVEPEVLRMISRLSDGSMRDAQSLLDRVHAFCEGAITAVEASRALGAVERRALFEISQAIFSRDPAAGLAHIGEVFARGTDPGIFLREFVTHFRELLIARFCGEKGVRELGLIEDEVVDLLRQASSVSAADLQDLVTIARTGCDAALRSAYPKYAFEALIVRLATREPVREASDLLARLESLLGAGGSVRAAPAQRPAPTRRPPDAFPPAQAPVGEPTAHSADASTRASEPATAVEHAVINAQPGAALDWAQFVRHVASASSRVIAEHLRRVSVTKFEIGRGENLPGGAKGVLAAGGPDFTVQSLMASDNKAKLEAVLESFTGVKVWEIHIIPAAGALDGSLQKKEAEEKAVSTRTKIENISNHPTIRSLQKVFPGSKIENIKVRE